MRQEGPGAIHSPNNTTKTKLPSSSRRNTSPSMHLAHRVPPNNNNACMLLPDGSNALETIHKTHSRIERLSDSIRRGSVRGVTGLPIQDVVVVGKGVPVAALRFLYEALRRDEEGCVALRSYSVKGDVGSGGGGNSSRQMRFVSCMDPASCASAVSGLNPATTIVVTITINGDEETLAIMRTMKSWLLQGLLLTGGANKRADLVISRHLLLVTGNERVVRRGGTAGGVKAEGVFLIPEHTRCEAFTTFTAAGLLPLSLVFGWKIVQKILAGAHDLDTHFVETNPRHNLPVLLALADVWNDAFLHCSVGRIVSPFTEGLSAYPAFLAALESQTCGKRGGGSVNNIGKEEEESASSGGKAAVTATGMQNKRKNSPPNNQIMGNGPSAITIDGGLNGNYDRALYQGKRVVPSELIMAMDTQQAAYSTNNNGRMMGGLEQQGGMEEILSNHDGVVCSFFAHADELAFGSGGGGGDKNGLDGGTGAGSTSGVPRTSSFGSGVGTTSSVFSRESSSSSSLADADMADGNRPSTLLMCGKCDAFACGQLVALSEHRAVVAARLWNVDPFARGVGSSLREDRTERLKGRLQRMYERLALGESIDDDGAETNEGGYQVNLATSTILGHYANRMRDQKTYVVKGP